MKKIILSLLFSVLFFPSFTFSQGIYPLKEVFSFPDETKDTLLLAQPEMMALTKENIFVSDFQLNAILKYDYEGKLLGLRNEKGEGPGEFRYPSTFFANDEKVYLNDYGKEIEVFNSPDLSHYKTIKRQEFSVNDIVVNKGRIFIMTDSTPVESEEFYNILELNEQGEIINKFGKRFEIVSRTDLVKGVYRSKLVAHGNKIYALSDFYPVVHVYSLEGEFIEAITFDKATEYTARVPQNYKWDEFVPGQSQYKFRYLFRAIDVTDDGIYLALFDPDIIIDLVDFKGKHKKRYIHKRAENVEKIYTEDLDVVPQKNNPNQNDFYILLDDGIPSVSKFVIEDTPLNQSPENGKRPNYILWVLIFIALTTGGFLLWKKTKNANQL